MQCQTRLSGVCSKHNKILLVSNLYSRRIANFSVLLYGGLKRPISCPSQAWESYICTFKYQKASSLSTWTTYRRLTPWVRPAKVSRTRSTGIFLSTFQNNHSLEAPQDHSHCIESVFQYLLEERALSCSPDETNPFENIIWLSPMTDQDLTSLSGNY